MPLSLSNYRLRPGNHLSPHNPGHLTSLYFRGIHATNSALAAAIAPFLASHFANPVLLLIDPLGEMDRWHQLIHQLALPTSPTTTTDLPSQSDRDQPPHTRPVNLCPLPPHPDVLLSAIETALDDSWDWALIDGTSGQLLSTDHAYRSLLYLQNRPALNDIANTLNQKQLAIDIRHL
jgi:hypothetical protein